jgi:hypothetical protein
MLVLALAPAGARADVFKPTRHDDPKPGKCKPNDCSFREALIAANSTLSKHDKVILGKGTYKLQIPPGGTPFQSGEFSVFTPVTIRGQGAGVTRIDGNGVDRVIAIGSGISAVGAVGLRDLTVTGGDAGATGVPHDSEGGGIFAAGETGSKLALTNVVVRGNVAQFGGGIFAYREKVTVKNSTLAGNTASEGGGIHVVAAPTETDVAIHASTISGNAAGKGGGILADGSTFWGTTVPKVDLLNSTVAGNHTSAEAGGIMADNGAIVGLDNSTVADNMADDDNSGGGAGGGIQQHSGAVFNLDDSIVDGNTVGTSGSGTQCDGTFSGTGNVTTAGGGCDTLTPGPNLTVGDAEILPLDNYGGPTKTVKLKASSAALGFANDCPKRDQRGELRPVSGCDSGSFERNPLH